MESVTFVFRPSVEIYRESNSATIIVCHSGFRSEVTKTLPRSNDNAMKNSLDNFLRDCQTRNQAVFYEGDIRCIRDKAIAAWTNVQQE